MRRVREYIIPCADRFCLRLRQHASFLHVALQGFNPCFYFVECDEYDYETRGFICVDNDCDLDRFSFDSVYLGSVVLSDGSFVKHFFEAKKKGVEA